MKKWAQWLINNNLRYTLYFIWLGVLPFYMVGRLFSAAIEFGKDALYDLKAIKSQAKD